MKTTYTILIKDLWGTESVGVIDFLPEEGQKVTVSTKDENGNPVSVTGEFICEL